MSAAKTGKQKRKAANSGQPFAWSPSLKAVC
jgi:hypothetical protein